MVKIVEKSLNNYFSIETIKGINKNKLTQATKKHTYNYITRTTNNNGVSATTGLIAGAKLNPANTFCLNLLQMKVFLQEKPWYAGQFVRLIKPKYNFNKETLLYFQVLINRIAKTFDSQAIKKVDKLFNTAKIKVPVTPSGELDTKYMASYVRKIEASYVRKIEASYVRKIEAYLSVLGYKSIDDVKLTDHEQKLLNGGGIKAQPTSKFKVGKLFNIDTGSLLPANDLHKGNIPRISVKIIDNGIIGYYDTQNMSNARHFSNFISVNFMGNAFYHKGKASVEMKVHVLYLANGMPLNVKLAMFLIANLNKIFGNGRFGYGNQLSSSKLKHNDFYIELPITTSGKPDYAFMEDYITAIEKLKVIKIKQYLDQKLLAYQELTK